RREGWLALYGPLSLIILMGVWAGVLIIAFALLQWAAASQLAGPGNQGFGQDMYFSGTTFFTLGLGDVRPDSTPARALAVVEAGMGFAFLAMVLSYLPVLYQAFSRREVSISLLDARGGTPPTAAELIRRNSDAMHELEQLLRDWERWSAEL